MRQRSLYYVTQKSIPSDFLGKILKGSHSFTVLNLIRFEKWREAEKEGHQFDGKCLSVFIVALYAANFSNPIGADFI